MAIDTIKSSAVLDGAIATADIADDAVTGAKIENNPTIAGTLAVTGHGSVGNAGTVAGTRALTVVGATDGTSSSIIVGYNSSLSSKFGVRDDGYTTVGAGMNVQGNITLASSAGIDFSGNANAAGMTSELLDDYEEGTFTPTMSTASSHAVQQGFYTKVGRIVHCQITLQWVNSGTSTGSLGGLPFTVAGQNYATVMSREWYATGETWNANLTVGANGTYAFTYANNQSTLSNGGTYGIGLTFVYRVS